MIEITIIPIPSLIEKTIFGQYLSLDFLIKNISDQNYEIQQLDMRVFASGDEVVYQRTLNTNGIRPAIEILGKHMIEKQSQICVFNPFHTLPPHLSVKKLLFEFHFTSETGSNFKSQVAVSPEHYVGKTDLRLPMTGRLIVLDGHDFYSHHRRVDLTHPFLTDNMGLQTNSGRYAHDFCSVNASGDLYKNEGEIEHDWYGLGAQVFVPGAGVVVQVENNMQDNILGQRDFDFALAADEPDTIMGNYVIIDHLNGEYSLLAHLKQGSVAVKEGDVVEQGQAIGELGFSGSTGPWVHLHYELRTGIDLRTAKGLPAYFCSFFRYAGNPKSKIEKGPIDTGEIVESQV